MKKLDGKSWVFKPFPPCPRCKRPFSRMKWALDVMIGIGRLPRLKLKLWCPCGYSAKPDGRVEHVVANHCEECGKEFPGDFLVETTEGFKNPVVEEALSLKKGSASND